MENPIQADPLAPNMPPNAAISSVSAASDATQSSTVAVSGSAVNSTQSVPGSSENSNPDPSKTVTPLKSSTVTRQAVYPRGSFPDMIPSRNSTQKFQPDKITVLGQHL